MDPAALLAALVIDNVLRHELPAPPHAPTLLSEQLVTPGPPEPAVLFAPHEKLLARSEEPSRPFGELLDAYLAELTELQKALRSATGRAALDESALLRRLGAGLVSADQLLQVAASVDEPALEPVVDRFVGATLRFAHAARTARDFPSPARFESPVGTVIIGSRGDDRHGPAALIVDPGGDDFYERAPVTRGSVSVIVDLGGNDRYTGSDVAIRGLSALIDLAGNDRYEMVTGLGAAIGGASLLVDAEGSDRYSARYFAQGAAAFGFGALVDHAGDDRYRIAAWGQGLGLAGGIGLLWDRAGNDSYFAAGESDVFERGAGLSGAQGAALGFRGLLGGGIGLLRDDAGDDTYVAQMFAQGSGYYYSLGFLWDGGGNDRYGAVRYAQGSGAHQAVGVLRDEAGNDRYGLSFGVGQGMGLDLAQGILIDLKGDDEYRGGLLVQGAATANGFGLLRDRDGANRFVIGEDRLAAGPPRSWGHAEWFGGLPSTGLLDTPRERARFSPASGPSPPTRVDEKVDAPVMPSREALEKMEKHPSCGVRAAALRASGSVEAAQAALRSSCWRLQAAALAALARHGVPPAADAPLPSFLR